MSNERLIERARRGDREAFRSLYRSLAPSVEAFVFRRVARREDAEDLVSRVFHKLLERLDAFDPNRGTVVAFVLTLARNAVIDHARTRHEALDITQMAGSLEDGTPGVLELLLRREDLEEMARLVEALPAETRELLMLRFGDGLSHAEIAEVTGLSVDAVRQRISRALRELKDERRRHAATRNEEARSVSDSGKPDDEIPAPDGNTKPGALHVRI